MGFVSLSIRGLREKIWIASQPIHRPAVAASWNPPAIEQCAPRIIVEAREPPPTEKAVR